MSTFDLLTPKTLGEEGDYISVGECVPVIDLVFGLLYAPLC